MAQAVTAGRITAEVLRGNPARLRRERRMRGLFFGAAFLSVLISVGIVLSLLGGTIDFLRKVEAERKNTKVKTLQLVYAGDDFKTATITISQFTPK